MTMSRAAILATLALAVCSAPAMAQQAAVPTMPQHIETTQRFLVTWGHQRWDDLRTVASARVTVKVGPEMYALEPGTQRSEVRLTLPFRGLSTVRTDGRITGVRVDEMVVKLGDGETRGSGTIELVEEQGTFRVTGVTLDGR
jgi:hypothetical protein